MDAPILPGSQLSTTGLDGWMVDRAKAAAGQLGCQQVLQADQAHKLILLEPPASLDSKAWVLEHFRMLITQLNDLISRLGPTGLCNHMSCPVMCCGELQYLCASHPEPKPCCAMDYMLHTVDGAASLLSSSKVFPSRLTVKTAAYSHFPNLARRLYRCLSHAWMHHPAVFAAFEVDTGCAARLTQLSKHYGLLAEDQLFIPLSAMPWLQQGKQPQEGEGERGQGSSTAAGGAGTAQQEAVQETGGK